MCLQVERPKRLGHNVWLGLGIVVIEWAFILKFGEDEIAKAGAIRGVDPFRFNPWYPIWAACGVLIGLFSLLHFAPPMICDSLFDYSAATAGQRKAVDMLLLLAVALPSLLGLYELWITMGYCDPNAEIPVWDRCAG